MRIVYRMRGLLGDATEEFIESLDSTTGTVRSTDSTAHQAWALRPVRVTSWALRILSTWSCALCQVVRVPQQQRKNTDVSGPVQLP